MRGMSNICDDFCRSFIDDLFAVILAIIGERLLGEVGGDDLAVVPRIS